jgi:hypothetical protein
MDLLEQRLHLGHRRPQAPLRPSEDRMALPCGRASFLANGPERKPNRVSTVFGRISTVFASQARCNHERQVGLQAER